MGIGKRADRAAATGRGGDEATARYVREHFRRSVLRAGGEAGDLHRAEVVDVIAEEAGVLKRDASLG
jgi:hypothetical protein